MCMTSSIQRRACRFPTPRVSALFGLDRACFGVIIIPTAAFLGVRHRIESVPQKTATRDEAPRQGLEARDSRRPSSDREIYKERKNLINDARRNAVSERNRRLRDMVIFGRDKNLLRAGADNMRWECKMNAGIGLFWTGVRGPPARGIANEW